MRFRVLLATLLIAGLATVSWAQYRNVSPTGDPGPYIRGQSQSSALGLKMFRGLLDPSRMHMSQSVSMGYASIGGRGVTQGLYMNQIDYKISEPLMLTTHLGYQFQPSGPAEWNPARNGNSFVGGADLNWRPTSNTNFRFSVYQNMNPNSYYDNYGWGSNYYRPYFDRP
jgi:hypothetical protein